MAFLHVAMVGGPTEPILQAVRELGAERVYLLGTSEHREKASKVSGVLGPLGVPTEWRPLEGDPLLGSIRAVQDIVRANRERHRDILVNLGGADRGGACAGLSAAFVSGVKAIDRPDDELIFLPVLHFSYSEVISEAKLQLLRALDGLGGEVDRLRDLSEQTGLQDSLTSYHIRGGKDGKGLTELGLVKVERGTRGALTIRLTPMGKLMARGMEA